MVRVNKRIQKRRGPGRPRKQGGVDPVVPVRVPKATVGRIDKWAKDNDVRGRSEAIRRMIEIALDVVASRADQK